MPPVPAAHMAMLLRAALAFVAFGLSIMAAFKAVGFANDYHDGPTESFITSLPHSLAVNFQQGSGSEPCPTCLFVGSDDDLLNYNGNLIDIQQLSNLVPTPTLPLKVSFAAPSTLHPEQTPTPQITFKATLEPELTTTKLAFPFFSQQMPPPPGASKPHIILIWCQNLFRYIGEIVNTTSISVSRAIKQQAWGIAYGIIGTISVAATVKTFPSRLDFWKSRGKDTSSQANVFAAIQIDPSFGPSLRNAEVELRNRLGGEPIKESLREGIIGIFKGILYSFAYAICVDESGPGGRNTRYFSIIDGQIRLIESLRLLHEHREDAYAENEELVKLLCRYDVNGKVIPEREAGRVSHPFDVYSSKDDKFLLSPLDGPTALSMRVSLLAPPLHGRPDANLEFDPHWQRFLKSVARKRAEQDARHASGVRGPMEEEIQVDSGIEDARVQDSNITSGSDEGVVLNGLDGEQTHHDAPRDEETFPSAAVPDGLSKDVLQSGPKGNNDVVSAIRAHAESSQNECGDEKGPIDDSSDGQIDTAKNTRSWVKWQIWYLEQGHGTPEDPDARALSDTPPATTIEETGDAALARQLQEEELAIWRSDRIESYREQLEILNATIASLEEARPLSKTAKRALERKTAKDKAKEAGEGGVQKPKPSPKKAEEDAEARQ